MRTWRRRLGGSLLAAGLAMVTAVPALAKDTYAFYGPLNIAIVGAGGDLREFTALSAEDRSGATALVSELNHALQGPAESAQPIASSLPHYAIVVSHLGLPAATMPWASLPYTSFTYYPGGDTQPYVLVEFRKGQAGSSARWIPLEADITAMLERHLAGLPAIGSDVAAGRPPTAMWGLAIGAGLLGAISIMLFGDRRRWHRVERRSAGSKGT